MGDALAHVLFAHDMKVTNFDIGSLVSEVLAEDPAVRPEPSIIDRLIQEELLRFDSRASTSSKKSSAGAMTPWSFVTQAPNP
jgi:hypothetical protein